jgi:hypothetical protein
MYLPGRDKSYHTGTMMLAGLSSRRVITMVERTKRLKNAVFDFEQKGTYETTSSSRQKLRWVKLPSLAKGTLSLSKNCLSMRHILSVYH